MHRAAPLREGTYQPRKDSSSLVRSVTSLVRRAEVRRRAPRRRATCVAMYATPIGRATVYAVADAPARPSSRRLMRP